MVIYILCWNLFCSASNPYLHLRIDPIPLEQTVDEWDLINISVGEIGTIKTKGMRADPSLQIKFMTKVNTVFPFPFWLRGGYWVISSFRWKRPSIWCSKLSIWTPTVAMNSPLVSLLHHWRTPNLRIFETGSERWSKWMNSGSVSFTEGWSRVSGLLGFFLHQIQTDFIAQNAFNVTNILQTNCVETPSERLPRGFERKWANELHPKEIRRVWAAQIEMDMPLSEKRSNDTIN